MSTVHRSREPDSSFYLPVSGLFGVVWTFVLALITGPAGADSEVLLPYPPAEAFGLIETSTYDEKQQRVGTGAFLLQRLPDERVSMHFQGGFDGGARVELDAILAPVEVDGKRMLRVEVERSQSHDPKGKPLVILEIDHVAGKGRCIPPVGDSGRTSEIDLPSPDRVVNVPLNLLFRPIGLGERTTIGTQAFFCLGGARVMGFTGEMIDAATEPKINGRAVREIRYGPDGKGLLSWAAQPFAPEIKYWVDTAHDAAYLAHRMPLYSSGPTVTFVANGVKPDVFFDR